MDTKPEPKRQRPLCRRVYPYTSAAGKVLRRAVVISKKRLGMRVPCVLTALAHSAKNNMRQSAVGAPSLACARYARITRGVVLRLCSRIEEKQE